MESEKIQAFADLPENWDSYKARRITPKAIKAALAVVTRYPHAFAFVAPSVDGGIHFEGAGNELAIDPEGRMEYSVLVHDLDHLATMFSEDPQELFSVLGRPLEQVERRQRTEWVRPRTEKDLILAHTEDTYTVRVPVPFGSFCLNQLEVSNLLRPYGYHCVEFRLIYASGRWQEFTFVRVS